MQIYYEFAFAAFLQTVKTVLILIQLCFVSFSNLMSKSCNPLCTGINYTILNSIKNSAIYQCKSLRMPQCSSNQWVFFGYNFI